MFNRATGKQRIAIGAVAMALFLPFVYTKAKFDNLPTSFIAKLKQGVQDAI